MLLAGRKEFLEMGLGGVQVFVGTLLVAIGCAVGPLPAAVAPTSVALAQAASGVPTVPEVDLQSLACASSTTCIAVGHSYLEDAGVVVPIENDSPGTPTLVPGVYLSSVACVDLTSCFAVGFQEGGDTGVGAYVPIVNGQAGAVVTVPSITSLNQVSCQGDGQCYAAATTETGGVIVLISSQGIGSLMQIGSSPSGPSIWCQQGGGCLVQYLSAAIDSVSSPVVQDLVNGQLGSQEPFLDNGASESLLGCSDLNHCLTYGPSGLSDLLWWTQGAWTPAGTNVIPNGFVYGANISCPGPEGPCYMVGTACPEPSTCYLGGSVGGKAAVEAVSGSASDVAELPIEGSVNAISCPAPTSCVVLVDNLAGESSGSAVFAYHQPGTLSLTPATALSGTAGTASPSQLLATYSDSDGDPCTNYVLTVAWGDGTPDSTLRGCDPGSGSGDLFATCSTASGVTTCTLHTTHQFATQGSFPVTVSMTDSDGSVAGPVTANATVTWASSIRYSVRSAIASLAGHPAPTGSLRVRTGQRIEITGSVYIAQATGSLPMTEAIRVTVEGKTKSYKRTSYTVTGTDTGKLLTFSGFFTPKSGGSYRYIATVFAAGTHQHKVGAFVALATP